MRRLSLTSWIFIGMAVGIALGVLAPGVAMRLGIVSSIFLRLIKSIIAPLLFGTLVYGIAGTGSVKQMGRIGVKAIVYFEVVTTIALFLGLGAVNLIRPGDGMKLERSATEAAIPPAPPKLDSILEHVFPTSIIDAMARGDVLQVVVFSFIFGAACAGIGAKAKPVVDFAEGLADVMFRYTKYVMYLAPLGVGAAMAVTIGSKGLRVLFGLGKLIATMYAAQAIFVVLVLGSITLMMGIPIGGFIDAARHRARRLCRWRSKTCSVSEFQSISSLLCCRPATASIWMARRFIFRWPLYSSRKRRACRSRSGSNSS
jgi:proton glutamate symport protein